MRVILAVLLLGAALVLAVVDWQATIGQGYAYRFSTLGSLIQGYWPEGYARLVVSLKQSGVPYRLGPGRRDRDVAAGRARPRDGRRRRSSSPASAAPRAR